MRHLILLLFLYMAAAYYHYPRRWYDTYAYPRTTRTTDRISRHFVYPPDFLHPDGFFRDYPPSYSSPHYLHYG